MKEKSLPQTIIPEESSPVLLKFGGVEITCPLINGHRMVPIKAVCEAIGVSFSAQDNWLKKHQYFAQLYKITYTTGADGKTYQMRCLSIFDIDGWVHSIGIRNRNEDSIQRQYEFLAWLREQKLELYKSIDQIKQENYRELELEKEKNETLHELLEIKTREKSVKERIKRLDTAIDEIRKYRFTGQTALRLTTTSQGEA